MNTTANNKNSINPLPQTSDIHSTPNITNKLHLSSIHTAPKSSSTTSPPSISLTNISDSNTTSNTTASNTNTTNFRHDTVTSKSQHSFESLQSLSLPPPPPASPRGSSLYPSHSSNTSHFLSKHRRFNGLDEPEATPAAINPHVTLYLHGTTTFQSILRAIDNAKVEILYESYSFQLDEIGSQVYQHLLQAANRGVYVVLVYDVFGSSGLDIQQLDSLIQAGGRVVQFNPVLKPWRWQRSPFFRNHRKSAVIDGIVGFTGGMNTTDEYVSGNDHHGKSFKDFHARIIGPSVLSMRDVFKDTLAESGSSFPLHELPSNIQLIDMVTHYSLYQPYLERSSQVRQITSSDWREEGWWSEFFKIGWKSMVARGKGLLASIEELDRRTDDIAGSQALKTSRRLRWGLYDTNAPSQEKKTGLSGFISSYNQHLFQRLAPTTSSISQSLTSTQDISQRELLSIFSNAVNIGIQKERELKLKAKKEAEQKRNEQLKKEKQEQESMLAFAPVAKVKNIKQHAFNKSHDQAQAAQSPTLLSTPEVSHNNEPVAQDTPTLAFTPSDMHEASTMVEEIAQKKKQQIDEQGQAYNGKPSQRSYSPLSSASNAYRRRSQAILARLSNRATWSKNLFDSTQQQQQQSEPDNELLLEQQQQKYRQYEPNPRFFKMFSRLRTRMRRLHHIMTHPALHTKSKLYAMRNQYKRMRRLYQRLRRIENKNRSLQFFPSHMIFPTSQSLSPSSDLSTKLPQPLNLSKAREVFRKTLTYAFSDENTPPLHRHFNAVYDNINYTNKKNSTNTTTASKTKPSSWTATPINYDHQFNTEYHLLPNSLSNNQFGVQIPSKSRHDNCINLSNMSLQILADGIHSLQDSRGLYVEQLRSTLSDFYSRIQHLRDESIFNYYVLNLRQDTLSLQSDLYGNRQDITIEELKEQYIDLSSQDNNNNNNHHNNDNHNTKEPKNTKSFTDLTSNTLHQPDELHKQQNIHENTFSSNVSSTVTAKELYDFIENTYQKIRLPEKDTNPDLAVDFFNTPAHVLSSNVWTNTTKIQNYYIRAIKSATKSIYITNPYVLPPRWLKNELLRAADRGVEVHLLLSGPGANDVPHVRLASLHAYQQYVDHGIHIYEYSRRTLHAKVMIVDQAHACVGSFNLDPYSINVNLETTMVFPHHHQIAQALIQNTHDEIKDPTTRYISPEVVQQWPYIWRLWVGLAYLISRLVYGTVRIRPIQMLLKIKRFFFGRSNQKTLSQRLASTFQKYSTNKKTRTNKIGFTTWLSQWVLPPAQKPHDNEHQNHPSTSSDDSTILNLILANLKANNNTTTQPISSVHNESQKSTTNSIISDAQEQSIKLQNADPKNSFLQSSFEFLYNRAKTSQKNLITNYLRRNYIISSQNHELSRPSILLTAKPIRHIKISRNLPSQTNNSSPYYRESSLLANSQQISNVFRATPPLRSNMNCMNHMNHFAMQPKLPIPYSLSQQFIMSKTKLAIASKHKKSMYSLTSRHHSTMMQKRRNKSYKNSRRINHNKSQKHK